MVFDRRFGLWGVSLFRWQVCGDPSLYCPVGSAVPTPVSTGYYTVGNDGDIGNTTRVAQLLCPIGHFCAGGLLMQCPGMSGSRRPGVACLTASDPVRFTVRAVVTPGRSLVIAHLFSQSVVAVSLFRLLSHSVVAALQSEPPSLSVVAALLSGLVLLSGVYSLPCCADARWSVRLCGGPVHGRLQRSVPAGLLLPRWLDQPAGKPVR